MDSPAQSEFPTDAALAQMLDIMWARFLPDILDRVATLEAAAAALAAGTLSPDDCKAGQSAAHKLAGTLGTFNLMRGTDLARVMEGSFSREGGPGPESAQSLAASLAELRSLIESRPVSA